MCVFTTVATNNTFFIYIPLSAYQRLQPRLNLKESEPFIPYKALLIVLSSVIYTLPLCLAPLQWGSTTLKFAPFLTLRSLPSLVLIAPTLATVAPQLMPDYTTRMSLSVSMGFSQPPCYLQDRDEIADEVIIAQPRNRYVKVTAISVHHSAIWHKPTSYGRIHKSAYSGHKRLNSHSFYPCSRPCSRHFALSDALYRPCIRQFANFLA